MRISFRVLTNSSISLIWICMYDKSRRICKLPSSIFNAWR